ncbi:MAG: caspase family protein [Pseudomonadota bacterium]
MIRLCLTMVALCTALTLVTAGMAAAKRLALVVGIDSYENVSPLKKARNDADAVGQALRGAGFEVMTSIDPSRREFFIALNNLYNRIESGDEVVFFFAGHGVALAGRNRLLPADVPVVEPGNETLLAYETLAADEILSEIQNRGARLTFLILDACRNNPFPRQGARSVGGERGLNRMDPPEGAFVLYSAGTGQTALDRLSNSDQDPNSVFTRALLPLMAQPGISLQRLAVKVREDVRALARQVNHAQFPAYYDQMSGEFSFYPDTSGRGAFTVDPEPAPSTPVVVPQRSDPCAGAAATWDAIKTSSSPAVFEQYLKQYGDCPIFAALANELAQSLENDGAGSGSGSASVGAQTGGVRSDDGALTGGQTQVAAPVPSGDACFDLWYQRNAIFQRYGYCFQTEKARRYFDISNCSTRAPRLSSSDLSQVETIRAQERSQGC